jgi:O-antigen/teichoic acid export membrane protein
VHFALGGQYLAAAPAVAILFLYPITACLTTLAYVIFSIMRRTGRLALFAALTAFLNIVGAYFMLASPQAIVPGFGLGALGVAVKTVGFAFLNLYLMEAWISRNRGWPQDWFYRFLLFGFLAGAALLCRLAGGAIALVMPTLAALGVSAMLFGILCGIAFYRWPALAGLDRQLRDNYVQRARELFRRVPG